MPSPIDPDGLTGPTRGEAYGPRWRRSSHGFFVPAAEDATDPDQRIVEAAVLVPRDGALTGWAALHWMGARWFEGRLPDGSLRPVDVATMSRDIRPRPGVQICEERIDPTERTVIEGVPVTTAMRSTTYAMRSAESLRVAVLVADMAMYSDLVSVEELVAHYWAHRRFIGNPQLLQAAALAEENCWSPQECLALRLPWVLDAGLPRPLCNQPVFDLAGHHLGTPDLLDEEAGVVGEYDGPVHLSGQRRGADVRRETAFRRVGLETFVVTAADAGHRDTVVRRMVETRARAKFLAPGRRPWTIEPPPGWVPTTTVAARRLLDEDQRRRWLAYRAS